jgi:hypothetical protein
MDSFKKPFKPLSGKPIYLERPLGRKNASINGRAGVVASTGLRLGCPSANFS